MSKADYLNQAKTIVGVELSKVYTREVRALRAHCIARNYPIVLLNTLTILDLILDTGNVPCLLQALAALEKVNSTLDTHRNPHMNDLRKIAAAADQARQEGGRK